MTARRALGSGPQAAHTIRAAQADLMDALPGVHIPDVADLRARGVLGSTATPTSAPRRALAIAGRADEEPSA
ncbi:hypothetical protein [Streptomyces sp. NPDC046832]|uniref:hypothetical protein n=1 Tax=Streptomyces sp. NPDC046832 TaxID=3155020 RepID=UPI00340E9BC1